MKKKIILIFSLIILSVCIFAFSSSASEFDFVINPDSILDSFSGGVGSFQYNSVQYNIPSDDYYYEMYYFTFYTSIGDTGYSIQPIGFKRLVDHICNTVDNCTYEQFLNACIVQNENFSSTFYYDWINSSSNCDEEFFNKLYYYSEIDETDLTEKFNEGLAQGKIDGVTEFKTTDEYKSQYTNGYTAGITYFKTSDEYAETLELERQIGQAEGKNNYLGSVEYKAALKKEYNNGYDTATSELEKKQTKESLGVILGSCGIVVLTLLVVYFLMSRKKHRRR